MIPHNIFFNENLQLACKSDGFFQVSLHSIDRTLLLKMWSLSLICEDSERFLKINQQHVVWRLELSRLMGDCMMMRSALMWSTHERSGLNPACSFINTGSNQGSLYSLL